MINFEKNCRDNECLVERGLAITGSRFFAIIVLSV